MFTAVGFSTLFMQTAFLGHDATHRQILRSGEWDVRASLVVGDVALGGLNYQIEHHLFPSMLRPHRHRAAL